MRSMWNGAITFGLVTVPVKAYKATENKDVSFRQVHEEDGGRIRYQRVCSVCGKEVAFSEIAKGYEVGDQVVTLTDDDLQSLPLPTAKQIQVLHFAQLADIDPLLYDSAYYLGPAAEAANHAYALLRETLGSAGKIAVVRLAMRTRERLGMLAVRGEALVLTTLLWPDEVREPDIALPANKATEAEVKMAEQLVDAASAAFEPSAHEDHYRDAVNALVDAKLQGAAPSKPKAAQDKPQPDLMAALQASLDQMKGKA